MGLDDSSNDNWVAPAACPSSFSIRLKARLRRSIVTMWTHQEKEKPGVRSTSGVCPKRGFKYAVIPIVEMPVPLLSIFYRHTFNGKCRLMGTLIDCCGYSVRVIDNLTTSISLSGAGFGRSVMCLGCLPL